MNLLARRCTGSIVIHNRCTNPFLNTAFEQWLFTEGNPEAEVLLFWRNEPVIVFGRNQNPWVECNVPKAYDHGIPLLRRYSGGGTVYHDLGNLNYCYMMPRSQFTRQRAAQLIVDSLAGLRVNERHDIVLDRKDKTYKVSGSAYRIVRDRAYHHGTLLLNVCLDNLSNLLCSPLTKNQLIDKGASITSVPSLVCNLGLDYSDVINRISKRFVEKGEIIEIGNEISRLEAVGQNAEELKGWQWTFGKTPKATYRHELYGSIIIENGCIVSEGFLNGRRLDEDLFKQLFCSKSRMIV